MNTNLQEVWQVVPDYPNYQVSSLGRVKSANKILSPVYCKYKKYKTVILYNTSGRKRFRISRLVALSFIPNPNNKPQVNHISGVTQDDSVSNLEWVTQSENNYHAYKNGLKVPYWEGKNGLMNYKTKKVQCLATGRICSTNEAAAFSQISRRMMNDMLSNRQPNWSTFIYL